MGNPQMMQIGLMFAFCLACFHGFCQQGDSSRVAVFYRAGRDITVPEYKEEVPLPSIGEAVEKGFNQADFVQMHFGVVYQIRNKWGLGVVYSQFMTPEIPISAVAHFETLYPGYAVTNPKRNGKLDMGSDFLSLHVEHSFQKKFLFFSPYAEAGIGNVNQPEVRAFMKQTDANRYLSVAVVYRSSLSATYTFGADLGVRFYKGLFSFSFSPSVGNYRWRWAQTDYSTDFYGRKTQSEEWFSLRQTHFLLMVNFDVRLPLYMKFYEDL